MGGFLMLSRDIVKNPLFWKKPYSTLDALMDLAFSARFSEGDQATFAGIIHLLPGQYFTSYSFLAERWGWYPARVRRFLDELERQGIIRRHSTPRGTILTIEKYALFDTERQGGSIGNGRTNGPKEEKGKNIEKNGFVKPTLEEISSFILENHMSVNPELFFNNYEANGWMYGKVQMKDWRPVLKVWNNKNWGGEVPKERKLY